LNRRSLTPSTGFEAQGVPSTRRGSGGARREVSSRVTLSSGSLEFCGWALNISRGGIRVVIEERVELGQEYEVKDLDPAVLDGPPRMARVVWVQDEPDGSVVGLEFLDGAPHSDVPGPSVPPTPSTPPAAPSSAPGAAKA
jgi:hypothetical protein